MDKAFANVDSVIVSLAGLARHVTVARAMILAFSTQWTVKKFAVDMEIAFAATVIVMKKMGPGTWAIFARSAR